MMGHRISGWILPCGHWEECMPWEHIRVAKELEWVQSQRPAYPELHANWDDPDDEKLRVCLAGIGLVKVCYQLVDADSLNGRQLKKLQELYALSPLEEDVEFIGRIKVKLQVRILLKLRDPERLNMLGTFG